MTSFWFLYCDLELIQRINILLLLLTLNICGVLLDLISFAQLKKREKHPWRSVTFSKVAD